MRFRLFLLLLVFLLASSVCLGQAIVTPRRHPSSNNPQAVPGEKRSEIAEGQFRVDSAGEERLPAALPVSAIKIDARIDGQIATVRVEHLFRNDSGDTLEGTYYFPVPEGATLVEFSVFEGDQRRRGQVKEKEQARRDFAAAVANNEDPAILEMTRRGWFQSSIYPIPPHSDKRVELIYSQVLSTNGDVITFDYPLGRGYKKLKLPVGKVEITIDLRSPVAIKNLFSPTHPLQINYDGDRHVLAEIETSGGGDAENFQLLYSLSDADFGMSLLTYRRPGEDGYFLLMLSPKVEFDRRRISAKDVVFVIDISLSMEGDKIRQAKEALRFGLTKTLTDADRFNIVAFGGEIVPMEKRMMRATQSNIARALDFVDGLKLISATNINDALVTAMDMFERSGRPQNLVFITDGEPTAGITDPDQIAASARSANKAGARLFTFGVGASINRVLLEKLAAENRGALSDINDQSQLARVVSGFFSKVSRPVLSDLQVDFGPLQADRVLPEVLPDLYTRSQIKIFGRYRNPAELRDLTITLAGQMNEQAERFDFSGLDFPLETVEKDFLPRLWATERVASLLAAIRVSGERPELRQEVIDLAQEFNLVTPYTSMYVPASAEFAIRKNEQPGESVAHKRIETDTAMPTSGGASGLPLAAPGGGADPSFATRRIGELPANGRGFDNLARLEPGTVVDPVGAVISGAPTHSDDFIIDRQHASTRVELSVSGSAETVVVAAVAPAVAPSVSHRSSSYNRREIRELPSLAPVDGFARLSPGVSTFRLNDGAAQPSGLERDAEFRFSINGAPTRSNLFTLDGQYNSDIDGRPVIAINNFDAVENLHVLTTRGSGDLNQSAPSAINLLTRSGANEFHGTVFDYHLDRRLSALSPLERRSGLARAPDLKHTLFGGTLGGPVRRDRAFFFVSFQAERGDAQRFIDSSSSFLTPTRQGLQQLSSAFPASETVRDLIGRGPMAQTIPAPRVIRTFTLPVLGIPVEFGQVVRVIPSKIESYEASGRMNFNVTRRDTLEAVYWYDGLNGTRSVEQRASDLLGDTETRAHLGGFRWNRTISPRAANEIGIGFNRARVSLGLSANLDGSERLPGPGVNTGFRSLAYGGSPVLPASHSSTVFEVADGFSYIAGRHNLKLGGQVRHRLTGFDSLPASRGHYSYASFEEFVLDRPSAIAIGIGDPHSAFAETSHHYYVDDAWRVRANLTFAAGLSYEITGQPGNRLADRLRKRESDPATALFDPSLPIEDRVIRKLDRDINNLAPRIGFAYTPRFRLLGRNLFGYDKTVIRGGAAVSYDTTTYRPLADIASSAPSILMAVLTPQLAAPLPSFPEAPGAGRLRALLGTDASRYARTDYARGFSAPSLISWHLTASRDFIDRLEVEVGYIGSRASGLVRLIDANPPSLELAPGIASSSSGPLRLYESSGRSLYNSLQARAEVRLGDQLTAGAAYTFSRLIDDVPDNNAQIAGGIGNPASLAAPGLQSFAQNPFDISRGERAISSLDRRHLLTTHFLWKLPLRRGQAGILGRLLGGWETSAIIGFASGSPFTPLQHLGYSAGSAAVFASALSDRLGSLRPFAANPSAPAYAVAFSNAANRFFHFFTNPDGTPFISSTGFIIADRTGFQEGVLSQAKLVYNDFAVEQAARSMGLAPDAFGQTFAAGRPFGDVGRNTLIGPRSVNTDFALLKTTKLSEKVSLQFRAEFFNLFNHPSRTNPNFILENAGGFGFADPGETDAAPRRVRLALKLIF